MIKGALSFLALVFFVSANLSASQKIVTFAANFSNKKDKIFQINKLGGTPLKDLRIINAIAAKFPDNIKDSKIYTLKSVIRVEDDIYQNWLQNEPASFNDIPLPSVSNLINFIKDGDMKADIDYSVSAKSDDKEIPWGIDRVNAPGAWNFTQGDGVKVAIVDTGVDYTHPDLAAHYKGGYNAINPEATPLDDHGHGTHVAGTIGAIRDGKGVAGVAPKAALYGVKVLSASGSGSYSDIIDGIQWCVENNIQIINMSLGGGSSIESFRKAIIAAKKAGITIVCAAGNDSGPVNYPAKYAETIAISASTSSNNLAYFSSRGPEIDFIAPGYNIYSTYKGGKYKTMSGTSMACPHVAGLAALAIAAGNNTPDKVKEALKKAAKSLGLAPEKEGSGLIDAAKIK